MSLPQRVVDAAFPHALDVFGSDESANEARYCGTGIKTAANRQVRRIFVDLFARDAAALGLAMPDPSRGKRATYTT